MFVCVCVCVCEFLIKTKDMTNTSKLVLSFFPSFFACLSFFLFFSLAYQP